MRNSREPRGWGNEYFQVIFNPPYEPRCHAIGAVMHQSTQIKPAHKPAQIFARLGRTCRRTQRSGEFSIRVALFEARSYVEKRQRSRVPLVRNQTDGIQRFLSFIAAETAINQRYNLDDDLGGEKYFGGRRHV